MPHKTLVGQLDSFSPRVSSPCVSGVPTLKCDVDLDSAYARIMYTQWSVAAASTEASLRFQRLVHLRRYIWSRKRCPHPNFESLHSVDARLAETKH